ncbi:MAG: hypothetical protein M1832_006007 [Thelocarpon impressellum]|nr:MAG: hypothetical protein M1832_006007 [Thelocarpon impressellum]
MKILTLNFLTCASKPCRTATSSSHTSPTSSTAPFPLHFRDAELAQVDVPFNPAFLRNVLPRVEWDALRVTAEELGFTTLPPTKPETQGAEGGAGGEEDDATYRLLHKILLETQIMEGKLVCGACGHEYAVREGIANFLLPSHLV